MKKIGLIVGAALSTFVAMYGLATFSPVLFGGGAMVAQDADQSPFRYAKGAPEQFDGRFLYHRAWEAYRDLHIVLADPQEMAKFAAWEHKFDNTGDLKTEEGTDRAIRIMRDSLGQRFDYVLTADGTKHEKSVVHSDLVGIGIPVGLRHMEEIFKALPKGAKREQLDDLMVVGPGHELEVGDPMEGGPAFNVLVKGDLIVAVDGAEIKGQKLNHVVNDLIRGKAGTKVDITVERQENGEAVRHTYTFTRTPIIRHAVHYSEKDGKAIIKIDDFMADNVAEDFAAAVAKADERNIGVVFDLRNNGGGDLMAATDMLGRIIPRGTLYIQRQRIDRTDLIMFKETMVGNGYGQLIARVPGQPPRVSTGERPPLMLKASKPMVVVINGGSASASEIFSGAVQGNHRGTIVGTPSIGKGVGQTVVPLPYGRSLHVTSFEFLPAGMKSDWIGIIPDQEVQMTEEDAKAGRDPQMDAALADIDRQVAEAKRRSTRQGETTAEHHSRFDCEMQKEHEADQLPVGTEPPESLINRECK